MLQVAERMVAAGLRVSFDVYADVDGAAKVPDILAEDEEAGVKSHCEVSVMYSARAQAVQSRAVNLIFRSLLFADGEPLIFCGRLLRPISDAEVDGLVGRVLWESMEARKMPRSEK